MGFRDIAVNRELRYAIGIEEETGRPYLAIPVSIGVADYDEYYYLPADLFERAKIDLSAAAEFAEECRRREHDDLLIFQPGWNRGVPV